MVLKFQIVMRLPKLIRFSPPEVISGTGETHPLYRKPIDRIDGSRPFQFPAGRRNEKANAARWQLLLGNPDKATSQSG